MADFQHAVLVPGGGLRSDGSLPPWTQQRLDRALSENGDPLIVLLSGGTVHKPPPVDSDGYPIYESQAAARYLLSRGVDPERIVIETSSFDTIGNAYFARFIHIEPLALERIIVVTSEFHAQRTEVVFRWIFGLGLSAVKHLRIVSVPSTGMSPEQLELRASREASSLEHLSNVIDGIDSVPKLHHWMFHEHEAYAVHLSPSRADDQKLLDSY